MDESLLKIGVSYPGKISQICGLELRSDSYGSWENPVEKLKDVLDINDDMNDQFAFKTKNKSTLDIELSHLDGSFVYMFSISTKDGSNLKSAIQKSLGEHRKVTLITKTCQ